MTIGLRGYVLHFMHKMIEEWRCCINSHECLFKLA
jgi:hypothetical protein